MMNLLINKNFYQSVVGLLNLSLYNKFIMFKMSNYIILFVAFIQCNCIPIGDWDISFSDDTSFVPQEKLADANSTSQVAQELGVSEDFLEQLKENWDKAVQVEKEKGNASPRQGDPFGGAGGAGGIGDFFGLGNGGQGGQGGGGGGGPGGQGGQEEEDEEDEEAGPTTPGPGAAGILTGLFGIFSGIGSLNPKRVIQSTVNFFPPGQRVAAQMALDNAFGIHNITTLAPLTNAPSRNATRNKVTNGTSLRTVTERIVTPIPLSAFSTTAKGQETTTRKKIALKQTSLLEDFEEALSNFNPKTEAEKDAVVVPDKPRKEEESSLVKDFADTAEKFQVGSVVDEVKVENPQQIGQIVPSKSETEEIVQTSSVSSEQQQPTTEIVVASEVKVIV